MPRAVLGWVVVLLAVGVLAAVLGDTLIPLAITGLMAWVVCRVGKAFSRLERASIERMRTGGGKAITAVERHSPRIGNRMSFGKPAFASPRRRSGLRLWARPRAATDSTAQWLAAAGCA